ncbi:calcium-binding protein [Mesorhizobium sp. BAC0120]|uniref:beta strand repeat-containing protein n=1 Tax=Mesorhizobium sp. BAC0120 TaxID=3090670 RepID=UPI00298C4C86|nr:calcium-binding protein [Mesorhizobium sp. BAC0120]MDW6022481.1 calcium-binding protein [Mesorhizobium sp. BAC0120]
MAITGTFSPGAGVLTFIADATANNLTISRNAAGTILANGGLIPILGGMPTVANTILIQAFGFAGNDFLTLDEANGPLPAANLFGGDGNDVMTGGSGGDMLFGQADNDTLIGKDGADLLFGGAGNDTLTGGDGNDQMFGEAGNDRIVWNPGDDSDLMEGGDGVDTAEVNGGNGAEVFTATANGARVRFDRLDPAAFSLDIGTTENLVLNMNGGDDRFSATGNLGALIKITVDGGAGNDTILGGNGADLLLGGDGNDFIDGNQGNDSVFMGAGNDVAQWDPGDGNDIIEGQAGVDSLLFNGANVAENLDISANGGRIRFTRDVANIVMDLNDVEHVNVNTLGGADRIVVNDLSGTDVRQVNVNLAGMLGGTSGDAQTDTVIVNGTNGGNVINVLGSGTSATVVGLSAQVTIANAEGANDRLVVNGLGGNDSITATTLPAGVVKLTIDGGAGNDTIRGSQGADVLIGGDGNDFVLGDGGNDVAFLGAGNDTFQWDPGDGNDIVEGQDGFDTLLFNGANISENVNIFANGGRAFLTRDVANVTMDLNGVERIDFGALGGADNVVVGDMTGTGVMQVNINLASTIGGLAGDGEADRVTVFGSNLDETIKIVTSGTSATISGLASTTKIAALESIDSIIVNGQSGADTIDGSGSRHALTLNGGLGNDVLIGGSGNDFFSGGDGNDVALMGAGNDTFIWNPGDDNDTLEGQAGIDTMQFNGANIAENIDISANGGRVRFFRDVANVNMDLNDVEHVTFNALGGADNIHVHDLSGTDIQRVAVNLAGTIGGTAGDGQADTIVIDATNGDDTITVTNDNGVITVHGLGADVVITNFDANDRLVINGLGGNDVIDASGLRGILLTADGGDGADVLIGSAGADLLLGGAGDDVLIGGPGQDTLDGGSGNNIVIQGATTLQPALLLF